jgi:threonine/homoserine/homoserine lactone efflux protein
VSSVGAFAIFAAVLAITPGLDTMLVLRTTALGGRRAGLSAVVGIALGCLVWAVASALGVTAVLAASRLAFEVLRWAGVVYLCYLGVRALLRKSTVEPAAASSGGIRTGLTTNLLNPKVGVFYLSVMPQFLPAGLPVLAGSLLLGAIHIGLGAVWLTLLVLVSHRAAGLLKRPTVRRRLEQLSGVVFLGFGLRLALERAPA